MMLRKFICVLTCLTAIASVHAADVNCLGGFSDDLYRPIIVGEREVIRFSLAKTSVVAGEDVYPINIRGQNCDLKNEVFIAELPFLGESGKIEDAFLEDFDFDGKPELFVIHRATIHSDTGVNYASDFFSILVFDKVGPLKYELNKKISRYFGEGGGYCLD